MQHKIQRVIDHIKSNLHRKLMLADLARLAGISRSRLCYAFKTETGISVGQYLRVLRIQKARELLETTSLSAKEIGGAAGMRDQSHFSRDFKSAYNLTPSEYRERLSKAGRKDEETGRLANKQ